MATKGIIPFEATHPGILIKDELDARNDINQRELAKKMGVKASFINEIIKGKRSVTADIAVVLEKILEISADYWMKFQSQYEIDRARIKEKNIKRIKNIEIWNIIKEYVPVNYFKKYKYLTNTLEDDINIIKSIYSINTIDSLVLNVAKSKLSFYRKSEKLNIDDKNMFAWSSLATYEAHKQDVNVFNPNNLQQLYIDLNKVLFENTNTLNNTKVLLNRYGIKFITINKLEKTPIDGYSFWSNNNPTIALTLRHSRIDNFAFTLFHELGHIDLHLRNNREIEFLDLVNEKLVNEAENEANLFAQKKIISDDIWNEILDNYLPLNDDIIIELGTKFGINPAILLGRVCFEMDYYAMKTKIDKKLK